jgi:hypothetical protein
MLTVDGARVIRNAANNVNSSIGAACMAKKGVEAAPIIEFVVALGMF